MLRNAFLAAVAITAASFAGTAQAGPVVTAGDFTIVGLESGQVKSAVGGLDLILMTGQNGVGVLNNEFGALDIDDANSDLPTGGVSTADESYVTTIGEVRSFYEQMFGTGEINRLVAFTDMQQAGGGSMQIELFEIVLNPTLPAGVTPPAGDTPTSDQNAIAGGFSGGAVLASTAPDVVAPVTLQAGSGWADWALISPIDPFDPAFQDDDVLLFHFVGSAFSAASETLFLSGSSKFGQVPEPAALGLLGLGLVGLGLLRRRR